MDGSQVNFCMDMDAYGLSLFYLFTDGYRERFAYPYLSVVGFQYKERGVGKEHLSLDVFFSKVEKWRGRLQTGTYLNVAWRSTDFFLKLL